MSSSETDPGERQIKHWAAALFGPGLKKVWFLCALVVIAAAVLAARNEARLQRLVLSDPARIYYIPSPNMTRAITLGYSEAAADLAWIRTLIYFGEETGIGGKFRHLDDHVELILALNPMFRRAYLWAGIVSIYSRRIITRERVEQAIVYLERGIEKFPYDGEMQYMLGFDLYFELPPFLEDEAEKRKYKLRGIDHFKAAIVSGTGPDWLPALVGSLLKRNGLVDLAIQSIEENLKYVEDPEAQKVLLDRLMQLKGEREPGAREKEMAELNTSWGREYPYLPLDMYLLVRPRELTNLSPIVMPESETDLAMDVLDTLSLTQ
jgi:hypothetical protein